MPSPQDVKLRLAFSPDLRQHLLDGLSLCFIACLPQSSPAQAPEHPAPLQAKAASHAALSTQTSNGNRTAALPISPAVAGPAALKGPGSATKAEIVASVEKAVQQIEEDLRGVMSRAQESAAKDKVSSAQLLNP